MKIVVFDYHVGSPLIHFKAIPVIYDGQLIKITCSLEVTSCSA